MYLHISLSQPNYRDLRLTEITLPIDEKIPEKTPSKNMKSIFITVTYISSPEKLAPSFNELLLILSQKYDPTHGKHCILDTQTIEVKYAIIENVHHKNCFVMKLCASVLLHFNTKRISPHIQSLYVERKLHWAAVYSWGQNDPCARSK